MKNYLAMAGIIFGVTACAPILQQGNTIAQDFQATRQSNELLCQTRIKSVPGIDTLAEKFPLRSGVYPSIEMLSNTQKPTEAERLSLIELDKATIYCNEIDIGLHTSPYFSRYIPPAVVPFRQEIFSAGRNLRTDLIMGRMTYGEYARARYDMHIAYQAKGAALNNQARSLDLQQQQVQIQQAQSELIQQQRNDRLMQQGLELMRLGAPRPITPTQQNNITCTTVGRTTDCTRY